jgi:thiol-disulfide isomerase/thioredoxin
MSEELDQDTTAREPRVPLGPGRPAFKKSTRRGLALAMAVAVTTALVVGILAATTSSKHQAPHVVTIPAADRKASPALLRAAEAVGFRPATEAGAGEVESRPLTGTNQPAAKSLLPVGSVAPGFTLRTPVGVPVSLSSLRGKTVLLELFATWCPHCAAEAPHLKAAYAKLPHDKYAFVALNADSEDAASVLAYHIWFGLPYPALLDPGADSGTFHSPGSPGPVSRQYKVKLFPTFYVIGPNGRIAWSATGEQPDALLLQQLRQASRAT